MPIGIYGHCARQFSLGVVGCADVVDIGETAYAMVLADDLDGDSRLDLLLATMNGKPVWLPDSCTGRPARHLACPGKQAATPRRSFPSCSLAARSCQGCTIALQTHPHLAEAHPSYMGPRGGGGTNVHRDVIGMPVRGIDVLATLGVDAFAILGKSEFALLQVLGRNGFTSRLGWLSVAATPATRQPRDVRGHTLPVRFKIDDPRPLAANSTQGPYTVFVTLQVHAAATLSLHSALGAYCPLQNVQLSALSVTCVLNDGWLL